LLVEVVLRLEKRGGAEYGGDETEHQAGSDAFSVTRGNLLFSRHPKGVKEFYDTYFLSSTEWETDRAKLLDELHGAPAILRVSVDPAPF
jgi:hypothetical protein